VCFIGTLLVKLSLFLPSKTNRVCRLCLFLEECMLHSIPGAKLYRGDGRHAESRGRGTTQSPFVAILFSSPFLYSGNAESYPLLSFPAPAPCIACRSQHVSLPHESLVIVRLPINKQEHLLIGEQLSYDYGEASGHRGSGTFQALMPVTYLEGRSTDIPLVATMSRDKSQDILRHSCL
jgi:hypothetical protein